MTDESLSEYMLDPFGRTRFFGIYEGVVVDINDPLNKNRILVRVPITGAEVTNWARAVLPIASNTEHADHVAHTAEKVAELLTTTSVSATGSAASGGSPAHTHTVSVTVPALTVVAKSGAGTLKHPRKDMPVTDTTITGGLGSAQETDTTSEHNPHRYVPRKGQKVWIMFVAGIPEEPVWIGVQ